MARKYSDSPLRLQRETLLQCDRACYGAEMFRIHAREVGFLLLQCDRACYGAEILQPRPFPSQRPPASM